MNFYGFLHFSGRYFNKLRMLHGKSKILRKNDRKKEIDSVFFFFLDYNSNVIPENKRIHYNYFNRFFLGLDLRN